MGNKLRERFMSMSFDEARALMSHAAPTKMPDESDVRRHLADALEMVAFLRSLLRAVKKSRKIEPES